MKLCRAPIWWDNPMHRKWQQYSWAAEFQINQPKMKQPRVCDLVNRAPQSKNRVQDQPSKVVHIYGFVKALHDFPEASLSHPSIAKLSSPSEPFATWICVFCFTQSNTVLPLFYFSLVISHFPTYSVQNILSVLGQKIVCQSLGWLTTFGTKNPAFDFFANRAFLLPKINSSTHPQTLREGQNASNKHIFDMPEACRWR